MRSARHFGATCRPSCAHCDPLHTPSLAPHQRCVLHYHDRLAARTCSQAAATDKSYARTSHASGEDA
eukprot:1339937-Prymnesium_polylepis.1